MTQVIFGLQFNFNNFFIVKKRITFEHEYNVNHWFYATNNIQKTFYFLEMQKIFCFEYSINLKFCISTLCNFLQYASKQRLKIKPIKFYTTILNPVCDVCALIQTSNFFGHVEFIFFII